MPGDPHDPTFALSDAYQEVDRKMSNLSEFELDALAGSLVAEHVNRGSDTDSALKRVVTAARGGAIGSKMFDREES